MGLMTVKYMDYVESVGVKKETLMMLVELLDHYDPFDNVELKKVNSMNELMEQGSEE